MLILGTLSPTRPSPVVREEEDDQMRGVVSAPIKVALLSVKSTSHLVRIRMICLGIVLPFYDLTPLTC